MVHPRSLRLHKGSSQRAEAKMISVQFTGSKVIWRSEKGQSGIVKEFMSHPQLIVEENIIIKVGGHTSMRSDVALTIRDLLYLDFDKAASIWSQFEEGLVERTSITDDLGKERAAGTKFGIPGVAEANLGVEYQNKRSILQTKTLHHDVLNSVERRLSQEELVVDLSKINKDESSPTKIREFIGSRPYLRAEGTSVLEDYKRIVAISQKFNDSSIHSTARRSSQGKTGSKTSRRPKSKSRSNPGAQRNTASIR
jgi:hypothetical protein